ncbi:MAG: hypothetical protein VYB54_10020 [Pseudomonadota bacterium]|nr:hypothetical protein [Pseudomonadota bacterium]
MATLFIRGVFVVTTALSLAACASGERTRLTKDQRDSLVAVMAMSVLSKDEAFKTDPKVQRAWLAATCKVSLDTRKDGNRSESNRLLAEIETFHAGHASSDVREMYADCMAYHAVASLKADDPSFGSARLADLKKLFAAHTEVQLAKPLAAALYVEMIHSIEAQAFDRADAMIGELRRLHEAFREPPVRQLFAKGLFGRIYADGKAVDPELAERLLVELRALHDDYPEADVRRSLVFALLAGSGTLGRAGALDEAEKLVTEIQALYSRWNDGDTGAILAVALAGRLADRAANGDAGGVLLHLDSLRDHYRATPEPVVRRMFGLGLLASVQVSKATSDTATAQSLLDEYDRLVAAWPNDDWTRKERPGVDMLRKALQTDV